MTQPLPESGDTQGQQGNPQLQSVQGQGLQQQGTGNRPPYAEYLERVPEALRATVEPAFKDWDANVTRMRQSELARLQEYSGYDDLVQQYEPEYLSQAAQLAYMLENDPQQLLEGLQQMLGGQGQQGANNEDEYGQQSPQFDLSQDPAFNQLQEQLGTVAQTLQEQQEQQMMMQEEEQVLDELDQLKQQYGEFDEEAVLMFAAQFNDIQKGWEKYQSLIGNQAAALNRPGQSAPIVGGGGNGNVPSNIVNPRQFTDQQRKEAALAIIRANNQQG